MLPASCRNRRRNLHQARSVHSRRRSHALVTCWTKVKWMHEAPELTQLNIIRLPDCPAGIALSRTASTRGAETHTRQIRSAVLGQTHYRALIYAHRTHPLLSSQPLWCDPFLFAYIPTQVLRLFRDSCAERCQFGAERPSRQESHETALQLCLICLCQSLGQAEATGREGLTVGWNRFPFPAPLRPV